MNNAQRAKLAAAYLKQLDAGKRAYKKADEIFDELLAGGVDATIELPGGRTATIVDQFATKNKVFKPAGVSRYVLDVVECEK